MAKVHIKSEKLTPFGGIFSIMEHFDALLSETIDSTLGYRCKWYGYQYSEIIRSLLCVYFCGGSCVEDVSTHLMPHLSLHPTLRTCSADTILRAIRELSQSNISYTSKSGKTYDFNTAQRANGLLINSLLATGELKAGESYDLDFDHQFIETEKHDAVPTHKKFLGYGVAVSVVGEVIVGIEVMDGNTNVHFHQQDTLKRLFERLEGKNIHIDRFRADCGSYSEKIVEVVETYCERFYIRASRCDSLYDTLLVLRGWKKVEINDIEFELNSILVNRWGKAYRLVIQRQKRRDGESDLWEGEYIYRCILTNDFNSSEKEIVEYYNQRGSKERILDEMNNGFGWNRMPKSFIKENAVFLTITALIHNFYRTIMRDERMKEFGLKKNNRIKAFVFKFISVPAKWIRMSRQHILNIYSTNQTYADVFRRTG